MDSLRISFFALFAFLSAGTSSCETSTEQRVPLSDTEAGGWHVGAEIQDCDQCPPLVMVPSPANPQQPLYIMRRELTWGDYIPSVIEAGCPLPEMSPGLEYPDDLTEIADNYPLNRLAPIKVGCYLSWLSDKSGYQYRLPKPDEWEHAARAGSRERFPWGAEPGYNRAAINTWFDQSLYRQSFDDRRSSSDPRFKRGGAGWSVLVEQFEPNAWGLYDVVGSLPEYVDKLGPPPFASCLEVNTAEACQTVVVRGGGIYTVTQRIGVGLVGKDYDFLEDEGRYFWGLSEFAGFRFVRDKTANRVPSASEKQ